MGTPLDSKETRMKDLNNMIKHFEERIEECRNEIRILQGQTTLAQDDKVKEMDEKSLCWKCKYRTHKMWGDICYAKSDGLRIYSLYKNIYQCKDFEG